MFYFNNAEGLLQIGIQLQGMKVLISQTIHFPIIQNSTTLSNIETM